MTRTKCYYPPAAIENLPEWLHLVQNMPTSTEIAKANSIRLNFLFPDDPPPYMIDITRGFRLLKDKKVYIEIGTYDKGNLAYVSTLLAPDAHLVDIDIVSHPEATVHLQQTLRPTQQLTTVVGDSRSAETLAAVKTALDQQPADAIFIDGNHIAEAVMNDYLLYAPLVKPGGYIFFHDVYWSGGDQYEGGAFALAHINQFWPIYVVYADHSVHRFYPISSSDQQEAVWGGVGIIKAPSEADFEESFTRFSERNKSYQIGQRTELDSKEALARQLKVAKSNLQKCRENVDNIKATRGWKMLEKYWAFRDQIRTFLKGG